MPPGCVCVAARLFLKAFRLFLCASWLCLCCCQAVSERLRAFVIFLAVFVTFLAVPASLLIGPGSFLTVSVSEVWGCLFHTLMWHCCHFIRRFGVACFTPLCDPAILSSEDTHPQVRGCGAAMKAPHSRRASTSFGPVVTPSDGMH